MQMSSERSTIEKTVRGVKRMLGDGAGHDGTVRAVDLREIKAQDDDFGLMSYDPAYMNTASCRSAITYIDGEAGVLQHRGYPIEQLCEHSSYLAVAYLLVFGELPT